MPLPYPILNTNKYKHKENYKKRFPKFSLLSSQSLWVGRVIVNKQLFKDDLF